MDFPALYVIQFTNRSGDYKDFVPPIPSTEQSLDQVMETAAALKPLDSDARVIVYQVDTVFSLENPETPKAG